MILASPTCGTQSHALSFGLALTKAAGGRAWRRERFEPGRSERPIVVKRANLKASPKGTQAGGQWVDPKSFSIHAEMRRA